MMGFHLDVRITALRLSPHHLKYVCNVEMKEQGNGTIFLIDYENF